MDGLLVGTFPDGLDLCHASPQADGPDPISRFRDFWCSGSLAFQNSDMPMGSRSRHVSSQMGGSDLVDISRLVMSQLLRPQELRFPDAEYPDSLRISDMRPKRMDGPDELSGFATYRVPIPSTSGSPICRWPISRLFPNP
jgi:hypothetical protein